MKYIVLLLVLISLLIFATPVYADTEDPDSTPTMVEIDVYRNLLETGDRLFLWECNIPYATTPDTPINETFYWVLLDTDNTTQLGTTTGYAYNDDGYGYNVFAMYFSAADALTWGQAYTLQLLGNPSVFDSPPEYNYPIASGDYTTLTDSDDNQIALAAKILELASDLDNRWGLTTTTSLILESESGTVLSIYGESFFRGAIYGVQSLAPAAFRMVIEDIEATDRNWTLDYSGNLSQQYAGTWIEPAKTGGGTIFGVGYDLTSIILVIGMCALLVWANLVITHDQWSALMDVAILLIAAPRIDLIPLSFTALVCAMAAMYTGTRIKAMIG